MPDFARAVALDTWPATAGCWCRCRAGDRVPRSKPSAITPPSRRCGAGSGLIAPARYLACSAQNGSRRASSGETALAVGKRFRADRATSAAMRGICPAPPDRADWPGRRQMRPTMRSMSQTSSSFRRSCCSVGRRFEQRRDRAPAARGCAPGRKADSAATGAAGGRPSACACGRWRRGSEPSVPPLRMVRSISRLRQLAGSIAEMIFDDVPPQRAEVGQADLLRLFQIGQHRRRRRRPPGHRRQSRSPCSGSDLPLPLDCSFA